MGKRATFQALVTPRARFDAKRPGILLTATQPPHVLTGDFNAHHPAWGRNKLTVRGLRLLDMSIQAGLVVVNTGAPTFFRGTMTSALNVTVVSSSLMNSVTWHADIETLESEHVPTYILIKGLRGESFQLKVARIDWNSYRAQLEASSDKITAHDELVEIITTNVVDPSFLGIGKTRK